MRHEPAKIKIPEGTFDATICIFDKADKIALQGIYETWRKLCGMLTAVGSRSVNLPDGLSENAVCMTLGFVKLVKNPGIKGNLSFDAYNMNTKKRIQIKACSILPDLTSFGPRSQWDELYFADFYRKGKWDGTYDIYLIPNELIYSQKVCGNKTVRDQQRSNRRPRFSIFSSIIQKTNIPPSITGNIY
jgi:hypothetical protein